MIAKKAAVSFVLLLVSAAFAAAQQPTPTPARPAAPPAPHTNLKVGDAAPDFTLPSTTTGQDGRSVRVKLSDCPYTCVETTYLVWRPSAASGWHRYVADGLADFVQAPTA